MRTAFDYISAHWSLIAIPVIVFIVSIIALFWLRRWSLVYLRKWSRRKNRLDENILVQSVRGPSSIICFAVSAYLGLAVSDIPANWKNPAGNGLWTLFVIALALALVNVARSLTLFYGRKFHMTNHALIVTINITRVVILVVAVLIVMAIWGVPTSPLILLIAIIIVIAILAFRDAVPNLFASFQIAATQEIKIGDYIKLDSQEEGYVTDISWNNTRLRALDGGLILIPNNILIHRKIINYGHPLKKATEPFHFNTRTHLSELTGLKARNLPELAEILKRVPEPVIYYHTHHFLEEHQYLIPELSNDFASWTKDALGNDALSERLANVSTFEYSSLTAFRDKLVNILEEDLARDANGREVTSGREFYFIKSVSVILPTAYVAHDLREFVEALRKISPGSLYFHIFESRLRLGNKLNDFSVWLEKNLDEPELAREIARIDPYTYTLEGLRSLLMQVIEKRIK